MMSKQESSLNPAPSTSAPKSAMSSSTGPGKQKKRAREPEASEEHADAPPSLDLDCDEVRQRIMAFLDTGEMKVGQFIDALGVSGPGYYRFMKQVGPQKGSGSDVFSSAKKYFARQEAQRGKEQEEATAGAFNPAKRAKKSLDGDELADKIMGGSLAVAPEPRASGFTPVNGVAARGSATTSNGTTSTKAKATAKRPTARLSSASETATPSDQQPQQTPTSVSGTSPATPVVPDVQLDGEPTDSVSVYDTCDEIRRKITQYLSSPNSPSQAAFLRVLESQYHTTPRKIQSVQLARFRGMKGPDAGNTSPVFYAAYVFFEKKRVGEGRGKSEARKKMEAIYPNGVDVEKASYRKQYWAGPGERVTKDRYGQVSVGGRLVKR